MSNNSKVGGRQGFLQKTIGASRNLYSLFKKKRNEFNIKDIQSTATEDSCLNDNGNIR